MADEKRFDAILGKQRARAQLRNFIKGSFIDGWQ